jgi:hypothetical protein
MKLFAILGGAGLLTLLITSVVLYISYTNDYTRLNNQYEAQVSVDQAVYDEVWKTIKQQAGVSEKYSEDFRKNYKEIMASRNYGGELMKWVQESNPNFTPDLYSKLMNTIESQRAKFTTNQKKLISIHKEMKDLTQLFPGSIFLGSKQVPELALVTSTQTEQVFGTHKEDSVELFK